MANKGTQFKKGNPGRPKGAQNRLSKSVKETVLEVFQKLQEPGSVVSLEEWAQKEPSEFYRIAAKLIPTDIKADVKHTGKVILQIKRGQGNND